GSVPSVGVFKKGDHLKNIDALNVRAGWGLKHKVTATLPVNTQVEVIADGEGRSVAQNDGYTWVNIKGAFGTGWAAADWLVKIDPPKKEAPATGWPYPDPVVPDFWEALMKEGATHVFSADMLWIRTNDLY